MKTLASLKVTESKTKILHADFSRLHRWFMPSKGCVTVIVKGRMRGSQQFNLHVTANDSRPSCLFLVYVIV